jgi:hypothetical protein
LSDEDKRKRRHNFKDIEGKIDKPALLDSMILYSAEEKETIMRAAGITKADIDAWEKHKKEKQKETQDKNLKYFIDNIKVSPWDIPL